MKFCLLAWFAIGRAQMYREAQLECAISVAQGDDTLVIAGTGSGKTMTVVLLILLQGPGKVTRTLSPLTGNGVNTEQSRIGCRYGGQSFSLSA